MRPDVRPGAPCPDAGHDQPGSSTPGTKYNIFPGEAEIEIDSRTLPGTTPDDIREEVLARLGDLAPHCELELIHSAIPVEAPARRVYELRRPSARRTRTAIPVPVMAPFATDGKHLVRLGVPLYGFSPLQLEPDERFLERFHGVDERVGVEALRWGLPVLYDVIATFCG